jgi:drug/metabolite transporter (DMT)-like permease
MSLSDGEIALTMLQVIALSLPVLAFLADILFDISEDRIDDELGIFLLLGGIITLSTGGLFIAYILWSEAESFILRSSITIISLGFSIIVIMTLIIYGIARRRYNRQIRRFDDFDNERDHYINLMQKVNVDTIEELREMGINVPKIIDDSATVEELKDTDENMYIDIIMAAFLGVVITVIGGFLLFYGYQLASPLGIGLVLFGIIIGIILMNFIESKHTNN